MDLDELREQIEDVESVLFDGCFSENTLRASLSFEREKRDFYKKSYNKYIDLNRTISSSVEVRSQAADLAERSKKCQKEASRLLDIVYEY